jgi:lysozyme family protein
MNMVFQRALEFVLSNEGGFVDDPKDHGGATKYGITQQTLGMWLRKSVSKDDVKLMSRTLAGEIYFNFYWCSLSCSLIDSESIATMLFDAGVLFGTRTSALRAQLALNQLGHPLTADGYIGPITRQVLSTVRADSFAVFFVSQLKQRIKEIVEKDPSQEVFQAGWVRRVGKYFTLAAGTEK